MGELLAEGQAHLFWGQGVEEAGRRRLLGQLRHLDRSYTGGLPRYIRNARQLLKESKEGACAGGRGDLACVYDAASARRQLRGLRGLRLQRPPPRRPQA